MPYEGEFAQYRSIKRLAESERVQNLLGSYEVRQSNTQSRTLDSVLCDTVSPSSWTPKFVLAVDGSHAEVAVQNGFPGAEASYITVASVIVDLAKTIELDANRPVNPVDFRKLEQADSIDCALPGCNVVGTGDGSSKESLRRKLLELLADVRMADGSESLLDTYEALLAYKPTSGQRQDCPYEDGCGDPNRSFTPGTGTYICKCPKQRQLFSPDALRIHEGMNPAGSNGALFAEVMQVLERTWIVHILRTMESRGWLSLLKDMAIVLDGPLAVFGHPAWLSKAIGSEIRRINEKAKPFLGGKDFLLIGVEKTGLFVQHLEALDLTETGSRGNFPSQKAALLDDGYIKQNIMFSDSPKPYGEDTYFGRKFFYKTSSGAKIVAMVPFLSDDDADTRTGSPHQFPRLGDVMNLLDKLVSSRYPNALAPLVSANAEAAIPMNLGKRVLENLARELISTP
jgi:hypothetical protein